MSTHTPDIANGGFVSAFVPVDLEVPGKDIVTVPATLKSGQVYKRGSVLGQILLGAASSAAKSGGNTGDGTFVLDATTPILALAKPGIYKARFITTTSIRLEDPKGFVLGDIAIGGSTGNQATIAEQIKAVVTQGATPFAAADGFDVTIAAGNNKWVLAAAAAVDGSDDPRAVLRTEIDATSADKNCAVAVNGSFNEDALVFGSGHTADTVRLALRDRGIIIRTMKYSG